jgi:outer membrane protein OmpA-like peptidoglycan-associated protein
MNAKSSFAVAIVFTAATACSGAVPPQELVNARTAYDRAAHDSTARLDPADLHTARQSLDVAEKSFKQDGDVLQTRDVAYTAERQVQIAESRARTSNMLRERQQVIARMGADQAAAVRDTSAALGRANQQIASQGQQLDSERQRRADAEKRASQAAADLARIASVKQEPRGMVITLSGSVLFASGKSELLPAAQARLSSVAETLTAQDPDSKLVVEGHTDSQGSADRNQTLSEKRAESVRTYLVSHGIASDRISAQGFGPSRAVADNGSPEGRANNRRVEIVVQPASGSGSGAGSRGSGSSGSVQ